MFSTLAGIYFWKVSRRQWPSPRHDPTGVFDQWLKEGLEYFIEPEAGSEELYEQRQCYAHMVDNCMCYL